MEKPHEVFRGVLEHTGDPIAAIKEVRRRFGLTIAEAKEVWLRAAGAADSLDAHQARFIAVVQEALPEKDSES